MGHNSSRGIEQRKISVNHPKFVNSRIVNDSGKEILSTLLPCNYDGYKNWKELLLKYGLINPQYLLLPVIFKYHSNGFCASRGAVQISFDNYSYLLTDEISHRKDQKVCFTEPELWYLLFAYLSAKIYLNKQCKDYPYNLLGDIRPQNVFLNQRGQVKFSCMLSWPQQKVNYQKTFDGITTYLSPQDYEVLELGSMRNEQNVKSQLFSIGLTLVSAALLKDNSDIYDIQKQKFDKFEVNKRINLFKCLDTYSEILRAIVSNLCSLDKERRIELRELWAWIAKYEKRIMIKQPFSIQQIPPKINQCINLFRTSISSIEPNISFLNLNSIKSLKTSRAQVVNSNSKELTYQVKNTFASNSSDIGKNIGRRNSKIIINTGRQQKIFYSPSNETYSSSQAIQNTQARHFKSSSEKEASNLQNCFDPKNTIKTLQSPVAHIKSSNLKFQPKVIQKSPEGYYSPKGSKKFKIFIHYKSPTKTNSKSSEETIHAQKRESIQTVKSVENPQKSKQTANKAIQINQNVKEFNKVSKLIEGKKEIPFMDVKAVAFTQKSEPQRNLSITKKHSPIHLIIETDQILNPGLQQVTAQINGISQVTSEQIIISPINQVIYSDDKIKNLVNRSQEEGRFQEISGIPDDFLKVEHNNAKEQDSNQQKTVELPQFQNELNQNSNESSYKQREMGCSITDPTLQKFHGLSPVKRQSTRKVSRHDSKMIEQELSRANDMKRIENALSQNDIQRHIIEEELYELTHDDGRYVVIPIHEIAESNALKLEVHGNIQNQPENPIDHRKNFSSFNQIIAQIFPIPKQQTNQIQTKVQQIQSGSKAFAVQAEVQTANLENQQKQWRKQVFQLDKNPKIQALNQFVNKNEISDIERESIQEINQCSSNQRDQKTNTSNPQKSQVMQKEILQMGLQIIDLNDNFPIEKNIKLQHYQSQNSTFTQLLHSKEDPKELQYLPVDQIIKIDQTSSKQQPLVSKPSQFFHHEKQTVQQKLIQIINPSSQATILNANKLNCDGLHYHLQTPNISSLITENKIQPQHSKRISHDQNIFIALDPLIYGKQKQNGFGGQGKNQKIQNSEQTQHSFHQIEKNGKASEIAENQVKFQEIKKPKFPFKQLNQDSNQSEAFKIEQSVPTQKGIVPILKTFSQLLKTNVDYHNKNHPIALQNQIDNFQPESREVVQEITDVLLNQNNMIASYQTVDYHHLIQLGGKIKTNPLLSNVIQVNQISFPPQKKTIQKLIIQIPPKKDQIIIQNDSIVDTIKNDFQKAAQTSIKTELELVHFDDGFLRDIKQTNQKLNRVDQNQPQIQNQQLLLFQNKKFAQQLGSHLNDLNQIDKQNKIKVQILQKQMSEQKNDPSVINFQQKSFLEDSLLTNAEEMNRRILEVRRNQNDGLLNLNKIKQDGGKKQTVDTYQNLAIQHAQQTAIDRFYTTKQDKLKGDQKLQLLQVGKELSNPVLDIGEMKEAVEKINQIHKYQIAHEDSNPLQKESNQHKKFQPLKSKANDLTLHQHLVYSRLKQQHIISQPNQTQIQLNSEQNQIIQMQIGANSISIVQQPIQCNFQIRQTSEQKNEKNRPLDFLDEVMSVNKVINHEQERDYEHNNKYLNGSNHHNQ